MDKVKLKILFLKTFAKTAKDVVHSIGAELPKDFWGQMTDLPELSWGEFNKQFLEFSMEKEGKNLLVGASETALWQREKKQELFPWAQALNNYRKYLKLKTNTWGNTDTFYPLSIVIMAGDAYQETAIISPFSPLFLLIPTFSAPSGRSDNRPLAPLPSPLLSRSPRPVPRSL